MTATLILLFAFAALLALALRWLRGEWRRAQGIRLDATGDDDSRQELDHE